MKDAFKATILEFLLKKGCIGGAHTPLDRVKSCIEQHSKQDKKSFEQAIDELVKQGWITALNKRTGKGVRHTSVHKSKSVKRYSRLP